MSTRRDQKCPRLRHLSPLCLSPREVRKQGFPCARWGVGTGAPQGWRSLEGVGGTSEGGCLDKRSWGGRAGALPPFLLVPPGGFSGWAPSKHPLRPQLRQAPEQHPRDQSPEPPRSPEPPPGLEDTSKMRLTIVRKAAGGPRAGRSWSRGASGCLPFTD